MRMKDGAIQSAYNAALDEYSAMGVDVKSAVDGLKKVPLSVHCWQGDDVAGFESPDSALSGGGLQVTGSHPGRARNLDELREDLETALSLIPGVHRVNLHAIYGDFGGVRVDRDAITPDHFKSWADWARNERVGLDFNASCFSHPLASDGWTVCNRREKTRAFWVEHIRRCREIGAWLGAKLGTPCIHNLWVPDGCKDLTTDRHGRRKLLRESLDRIFSDRHDKRHLKDSVEAKLFGIGSEAFVAGSHEFYMMYVSGRDDLMLCLDLGHFHPTESVADKVSALFLFKKEMLLHVSRGIRWDSDHVVVGDDNLRELMLEISRLNAFHGTHIALDYFDASLNRVGAWVIGARATLKAVLYALLEPVGRLRELENAGDKAGMLELMEECKAMPFGAVWNHYCAETGVPPGSAWTAVIKEYEQRVLRGRT
jgi:L-rhamnose isomerase